MVSKQVILIRKDIKMSKGKAIAQGSHAAVNCIMDSLMTHRFKTYDEDNPLYVWGNTGKTKVILGIDSLEELEDIENKANELGLVTSKIIDEGRTEFNGVPTVTALGIGPDDEDIINSITGKLKLL